MENFWDVEILSVKTSQGGQYSKPQKAGDVFLVFIVKVKNIASQEETVSSLVQFSLLDSTGQKYTETFFSDAPAALDGKVEPNAVQQGSLVYEVPAGEHRFELHFQVLFVTGQIIWNIEI